MEGGREAPRQEPRCLRHLKSQPGKMFFFTIQRLFKLDKATHMISVELWVLMTTLLLVVRFLIDFSGPWYSNRSTLATVQTIELINYSMVHYTLGLMQLSAKRVNDYFQVWAVLIVTLQYSVKIGRRYGRSKRIPMLDLMSSFWAANLLRVQTVFLLKIPLWFIWSVNAARIIAYFLLSERSVTCNEENARLVADYMRYEHTLSETTNTDSMSGYKYLVFGEDQQEMKREPGKFRLMLDVEHKKLITVEKIWALHNSRLLGSTADPDNRLKDVCLSYALYKLLRRRFYDLPVHEAGQEKTKKLVFEGILKDKNDYERVFRITGVELSFLQDFFHSKHAQMFASGFPVRCLVLSLFLVAATGYIAYPVRHIPQRIDPADCNRITHGVFITRFIVALIIGKEMSEIIMYVFSQWTKVLMICMHIECPRLGRCWLVEKAMRCMFRLIRKGNWNQKIRQYNLLISSRRLRLFMTIFFPTSINLETEVKKSIFESFKGLEQNPERLETYFSNAFGSNADLMMRLEWAIDLEADTHRILVWHIATCLCEINLSDDATALKTFWLRPRLFVNKSRAPEGVWKHYITASSLSNYCAYLLIKALVPDNGLVVDKVFGAVLWETNHATFRPSRFKSLQDIYDELMRLIERNEKTKEGRIIMMGARLGKQLIETYAADRVGLWADLAKFWTGFLLHLAASTSAMKHKTHLAGSGELITHLWALLSHAGFLGISHGEQLLDPVNLTILHNVNNGMNRLN